MKRLLIPVCALLTLGLAVAPARSAPTLEREFRYERSRFALSTENGRTVVDVAGATREFRAGHPDLPMLAETVDLPDGFQVASVEVVTLQTEPMAESVRLPSAYKLVPGVEHPDRTPEDPAAFSAVGFQPTNPVVLGAQGLLRGHGVALLSISPVRWDASTGRLERVTEVRVRLTLEAASFPNPAPRERIVPEWEDDRRGNLAPQRVGRFAVAPANDRGAHPFAATQVPSLLGSPVEYLIITNDEQAPAYQVFADWKTRTGVPAVVRTVSFVRANYPGASDDAERIRMFIRDAYSRWGTKWVLLGGDTGVIPTRYATTTFYGGENIACDLYYSCLDGSWNADGDSAYGEGYQSSTDPGDSVDLFPDVYVGRAPSTTVADAQQFVSKSMQYVSDPDTSGYQAKTLMFAEVLFPQNWTPGMTTTLDGAELTEEILPYFGLNACQSPVRLYENYTDPRWVPGALQEKRVFVLDSLDSGYNLAIHVGHGYRNVMSVGDDNITNADAMGLTNGRKLTNLYAIDCTSCAIDFPCIGEAFMHAPNGGAVTVIGSTRFDFPTAGRAFQKEYYRLMFQDSVNAIGELQARQKLPFIAYSTYDGVNRWTEMTLLELGDPELRFYTCVPRKLVVTSAPGMSLGDSTYTVNVQVGGVPLYGALVTLYKAGDDYASVSTDGAGNATLVFHPDSVGTIQLTVTDYNCKPYQANVSITPSAGEALTALVPTVKDDGLGGTVGNNNGQIDAGETVDLFVPVRNNGGTTTGSVFGQLSTTDSLITITSGSQFYGVIPAHGTATSSLGFRVVIPYTANDQRELQFRLDLIDANGSRFASKFQLPVHAPELRHFRHVIVDNPGNGNGLVDPGETINYSVRLTNVGTGTAPGATAVLRSLDGLATITDSTATWGPIAPGGEVQGDPFVFVASSTAARFQLVVSDAYGQLFTQTLDVVPPAVPTTLFTIGETTDIQMNWAKDQDPDLLGYNIYRATVEGGPYTRINPVPTPRTSYYMDQNLAPLTRYFYKVTSVDSSGNESGLSLDSWASTSPPSHAIFPVPTGRNMPSPVAIDHVYSGYPVAIASGSNVLYVYNPDGTAPVDADGAGATLGDFTTRGSYYAGGASIADLDGSGVGFISTTWDSTALYAFDKTGAIRPGFPLQTGDSFSGVAIDDIDGDGKKEMVFATNNTKFYVVRSNGGDFIDGDNNPSTIGVFKVLTSSYNYGTPAIADLNNDGKKEIVYGDFAGLVHAWKNDGTEMPGFPVSVGAAITGSIAVGYLDGAGDSQAEIVVPVTNDSLYVFEPTGARRAGWPKHVMLSSNTKSPSPALADMNRDGFLDIVQAGTDGAIYVFDRNGVALSPWVGGVRYSSMTFAASECSPVVADINGDGWPDVVTGSEDGTLAAIDGLSGTMLAGFPIGLGAEVRGAPAVCDCDGDGKTEIVVDDWDGNVYMWDYDFPFSPGQTPPWPQFHHDARRTGFASSPVFLAVDDGGPNASDLAPRTLTFSAPQPNPSRSDTRFWFGIPSASNGQHYELTVYDLSGRRIRTVAEGTARGGRFSAAWDLSGADGAKVHGGVYFVRFSLGGEHRVQKLVVLR